ncbi:alpha mannosidase [Streptococcus pneumoniae]|nr:alpha mannosidase [Streptococcus pneumoniae]
MTILRASGELGDWGYFPTPEAQCLREFEVEFAIECHQAQERFSAYRRAKALQTPFTSLQLARQEGSVVQTILDLLERPYPVHSGLLDPQEIRTEFIKKEEI